MSTLVDMFGTEVHVGDDFLYDANGGFRVCRCLKIDFNKWKLTFVSAARVSASWVENSEGRMERVEPSEPWTLRRRTTVDIPRGYLWARYLLRIERSMIPPELLKMFDEVTPPTVTPKTLLDDLRKAQQRVVDLDRVLGREEGHGLAEIDQMLGAPKGPQAPGGGA